MKMNIYSLVFTFGLLSCLTSGYKIVETFSNGVIEDGPYGGRYQLSDSICNFQSKELEETLGQMGVRFISMDLYLSLR